MYIGYIEIRNGDVHILVLLTNHYIIQMPHKYYLYDKKGWNIKQNPIVIESWIKMVNSHSFIINICDVQLCVALFVRGWLRHTYAMEIKFL